MEPTGMSSTPGSNGSTKVLWWILSTVSGLALGLFGSTIASTARSVTEHGERIAVLESRLEGIDRKAEEILRRLK